MILHLAIQIYIILPHFNILPYVYLYFLTIFNIQFTQKFIKHDSHFAQKKIDSHQDEPETSQLAYRTAEALPQLFICLYCRMRRCRG